MKWYRARAQYQRSHGPAPNDGICLTLSILAALTVSMLAVAITLILAIVSARAYEIVVPQACVKLAEKFGATAPPTFTREQAEAALAQLGFKMIAVAEARACRAALTRELKK